MLNTDQFLINELNRKINENGNGNGNGNEKKNKNENENGNNKIIKNDNKEINSKYKKYLPDLRNELLSISPIDGRYHKQTKELQNYFSEFAYFRHRIKIEIEYFIFLIKLKIPELLQLYHEENYVNLRKIYKNFDIQQCILIKNIEKETNNDIKAIEIFLRINFEKLKIQKFAGFIHYGLSMQDINNTALTISIRSCNKNIIHNYIDEILKVLKEKKEQWTNAIMLSHTHGNPNIPTTMGKEFNVFYHRIDKELRNLYSIEYYGKFGGETGNLNCHYITYSDIDWDDSLKKFLLKFELIRDPITTQADNYENITCMFDILKRINSILINLNQDIWLYISKKYLVEKENSNSLKSSDQQYSFNPIHFENSEGNLMIANTLIEFIVRKLPLSRLQRDHTDSTITRNIGTIYGHMLIAYNNLLCGLELIQVNREKIHEELKQNCSVIIPAIKIVLKKHGYNNYDEEISNFLTNNKIITKERIHVFINGININNKCREQLNNLSLENYIGNCFKEHLNETLF